LWNSYNNGGYSQISCIFIVFLKPRKYALVLSSLFKLFEKIIKFLTSASPEVRTPSKEVIEQKVFLYADNNYFFEYLLKFY
jgi:hypothetical protein